MSPLPENRRSRRAWLGALLALLAVIGVGSLAIAVGAPSTPAGGPPNDKFARAQTVGVSGVIDGTTAGATAQPGEPGVRPGEATVWFAWTPTAPGQAFVVPGAPGTPVRVRAYTGTTVARLVRVDRPDAGGSHVLAAIDALAGTTYWLQVTTPAGAPGAFQLSLVQPGGGRPANDTLASAAPLGAAVRDAVTHKRAALSGSTAGAAGGVWYSWVAPPGTRGRLQLALAHTSAGAHLALGVYERARADQLRRLAPAGGGPVTFAVSSGGAYAVKVSGGAAYFDLALKPVGAFALDTTAPLISCQVPRHWVRTNAAVPCRASDGQSGLARGTHASFTLTTAVAPGAASATAATGSVVVCDRAGNCATAGPETGVHVDLGRPVVQCEPSGSGSWSVSAMVDCQASDPPGGSGLAVAGDGSFTLTAALPLGRFAASAPFASHPPVCDRAGNCVAVPVPKPVRIDHAPPVVRCEHAPHGWASQVTFRCTATDAGSGLAAAGDASFQLTTQVGAGASSAGVMTTSHEVCDVAGNCTKAGPIGPLEVDREAPVVRCATPAGWVRGDRASVRCTARDARSGLAKAGEASFALVASVPAGGEATTQSSTRLICDRAHNCITAGPLSVALDDRPPSVRCASVPRGWVSSAVTVGCSVSDGGSGVSRAAQLLELRVTVPAGSAATLRLPRRRVCDSVGNCTLTPRLGLARIDRQAPVVRCAAPAGGRHRVNVVVRCHASDRGGSGLGAAGDSSFTLSTGVGAGALDARAYTGSKLVCDQVGNCVTAAAVGPFVVDRRR